MKKQVTFAHSQTEPPLQKHRFSLPTESKIAAHDINLYRRYSTPSERRATVHIPRSMATAPFLKHCVLTPAQKEYLYTVASSHSGERVRGIITQYYMNIVHRCIRAGHSVGNDYVVAPEILPETVEPPRPQIVSEQTQKKQTALKHKGKTSATVKKRGKSVLPLVQKRQSRVSKSSGSKQRKKVATPPKPKPGKKMPVLSVEEKEEEEEEEEEEEKEDFSFKDSLSDCLSSLSFTDWDQDSLSDLDP